MCAPRAQEIAICILVALAGSGAFGQGPPLAAHPPAASSPLLAAEKAASGSAQRTYLPPGRGFDWSLSAYKEGREAVPDPPVAINVKAFGARGDGVADDTAALQAALQAAQQSQQGGVIFLPAGTYILSRPLVVTRSNVVLRGAGQGLTIIHIPVSLSDVYQGTWSLGNDGTLASSFSFGGAFILFRSVPQRSRNTGTLLATINAPVTVGSIRLPVDSSAPLRVGQRVRIFVNDASTMNSRRRLRQAEQAAGANDTSDSSSIPSVAPVPVQLSGQPVPSWMAADPVWQAAAEGRHTLGAGGAGGLSTEQALQADAEASAQVVGEGVSIESLSAGGAAPAPQGAEGLAGTGGRSAPNTIAAWIYGESLVDSGSGDVLDEDEVSVPARVTAAGPGWFEIERGLPFPVKPGWRATVHLDAPSLQNSGIESLTIRFKHTLAPEHFADRGYNGLQFSHAANCWARNVTILNADNGLFVTFTDRSTFRGITVAMTVPRLNPAHLDARNGHHAISVTSSHANLVASYRLPFRYIHDITLASAASLNVIADGAGIDTNLDMHRAASYGNLLTNLDLGLGLRPFQAGGRGDRGAHSGRLNTFWNVRSGSGAPLQLPPCDWGPMLTFVGPFRGYACPGKLWMVQPLAQGSPPDLYDAQRELRRQREAAIAS
ncbi:hypothetical protein ABPG75_012243 [Micractinium tetrahymenae]